MEKSSLPLPVPVVVQKPVDVVIRGAVPYPPPPSPTPAPHPAPHPQSALIHEIFLAEDKNVRFTTAKAPPQGYILLKDHNAFDSLSSALFMAAQHKWPVATNSTPHDVERHQVIALYIYPVP
jgi:hypothetical protein